MTQTSFTVSSEGSTASSDLTTLNGVIRSIDVGGTNAGQPNYTITLSGSFTLTAGDLLAFNAPGSTVTIQGANFSINGNGNQRGLFVYSGTVDVNNLTLTNMQALGGNGGGAHGGAGGGAGLGGGLFVASAGAAVLDNVTFSSDRATGGAGGGGSKYPADYAIGDGLAGGGGMGGNGAARGSSGGQLSQTAGGGGGLGLGANGGSGKSSSGLPGLPGIVPGVAAGGSGYLGGGGGAGGASGGGGGGGNPGGFGLAGGGGIGGHTVTANGAPNNGGFGGGGGAGAGGSGAAGSAGNGGFGGGGGFGSNGDGGSGGFGGGGGDANLSTHGIHVGDGGFGGGNAGSTGFTTGFNWGGGGGGLGAGADIFVQQGGALTIEGGSLGTGTVNVGAGGTGGPTGTNGGAGGNYGQDIFIQGNQSITFEPPSATTMTLSGTIADESGNGGGVKNPGAGSLVVNGAGTLQLAVANTYTGMTTLDEGTLELQNASAAGSNEIVFSTVSTATLKIDLGDTPSNTIKGFIVGEGTIDLAGIGTATAATISSHTLTVDYGSSSSLTLKLDASENYTGDGVKIVSDTNGGTLLDMENGGPVVTAGGTATFDGGGSPVLLDSNLAVTDSSATNLVSATVTIGSGYHSGDTLNFTTQNGISEVGYSNGTLTLTGSSAVGNYQTALDSITYSFSPSNGDPTVGNTDTTRTIQWVASDGTVSNTAVTSTLDTVHEPPTVTAGASINYEEGQSTAVVLDSTLTLTAPDSGDDLSSATVSIGAGFATGDTLNFTTQNGISEVSDSNGTLTLSGSSSLANYATALDSVTFSTTSTTSGSRTVDWVVGDGTVNSTAATSTVDVKAGPSVVAGASINYEEGQSTAVALDGTLTLADPSNTNLSSATVSIGAGFATGDTLNFTTQNGISEVSDSNGTLTLSGSSSLANYATALDSVTFSTTSTTSGSRTVDWVVGDGTVNSTAATSTVDVKAGPSVVAGASINYEEGQSTAVALDGTLTLADPSNTNLSSATVSIGAGFATGDTLNFTTQNGISEVSDSNGTLTLSGSSSLANYATALDSVTFSTTSTTSGSRTVDWVVGDGTVNSTAATSTVDVKAGPSVVAGASINYEEGQSTAVALDGTLTLADPSNTNLSSATVSIGAGFATGDTLNFTTQNGISEVSDSNGTLTLSGSSSLANYATALDSVTFSTTSTTSGSRTVDWVVGDGTVNSTAATSTVDVKAGPSVVAGASINYEEGQSTAVALDGTLTLADPSNTNLSSATVSIGAGFATGDTLNFTTQNGISEVSDSNGTLTLSGSSSLANYATALDSVTFSTTSTTSGSRTVDWVVGDGTVNSTAATSTVDVKAGPSVVAGASINYEEGQSTAVALDGTLTLADPSNTNLSSATVSIGAGFATGDTLNFTTQNGISEVSDSNGTLTLSGSSSLANYATALDSVTFSTTSTTSGSRTVDWVVGDGTVNSTAATSTVDVKAGPSVVAGASINYEEGQSTAVALDGTLTLADPSNTNLSSATVSIGAGFATGDTLNFTTQNGISEVSDSNGTLTLSGSSSLANYATALDSVTFSTTSTTSGSRTVDWVVGDGTVNSTAATSTVDVKAGPSVVAGASINYEEGQSTAVALDGTLTLADPSNTNLSSATVSIGAGFATGDTLNFTTQNGISEVSDSNGTLTLSGSSSLANYATALDSVTFSTTSTTSGSRTVDWVVGDGTVNSTAATSTVDVKAGPSVVAGATASFTGGGSPVVLDGTLTLADPSNTNLSSATVSIGAGFAAGDTLNFTTQNGISEVSDSNGTLTLSGSSSLANYATALDSVTYSFTRSGADPTDGGTDTSRTVDWVVGDGTVNSAAATSTLDTNPPVPPTIIAAAAAPSSGDFGINKSLAITLTMSVPVTVTGTPTLSLNDNGVASYDAAKSSGSNLAFDYTVAAGQDTADLTATSLNLPNGASIVDGNSTNAVLTLPASATFTGLTVDTNAPALVNDSPLSLAADTTATITTSLLQFTDNLSPDAQETYTITSAPQDGTLQLNGSPTTSFTQADIDNGLISYQETVSTASSDSFGFTVTDAAGNTTAVQQFSFQISPAPAQLLGTGLRFVGAGRSGGASDNLVWQNSDGTPTLWTIGSGGAVQVTLEPNPGPAWQIVALGDLNSDGSADLLFQYSDGTPAVWFMSGTNLASSAFLPNPGSGWSIEATGDFYDTGHDNSILWQSTGRIPAIWEMNGTAITNSAALPDPTPGWSILGTGDFFDTGFDNTILWQSTGGVPALWEMNGGTLVNDVALPNPGPGWSIRAEGNFVGDGHNDSILLQNTNGLPVIWQVNGPTVVDSLVLPNPGPSWTILGVGDVTGNGLYDIFLQNTSGQIAEWSMNGSQRLSSYNLTSNAVIVNGAGSAVTGSGSELITLNAANQTFIDGPTVYTDTLVGFSQGNGDRIHLTTDTVADALAHTTSNGQDTRISLADGSTINLKGITHIDATFFS